MVQMKKILGILLAVCFVLSVTAAAASAHEGKHWKKDGHWEKKWVEKVVWKHGHPITKWVFEWVFVEDEPAPHHGHGHHQPPAPHHGHHQPPAPPAHHGHHNR